MRQVIDTSSSNKDGLNKCPQCGSAEVRIVGMEMQCDYCKSAWPLKRIAEHTSLGIETLRGTHIGLGADDIDKHASDLVTIKCQGCGAPIVINTDEAVQAQCHWCRQTLSVNEKIPNGHIPDLILPFAVEKEQAEKSIKKYIGDGGFFVDPEFRKGFDPSKLKAVYLPYVLMDGRYEVELFGLGEKGSGVTIEENLPAAEADQYVVERKFDVYVDDFAIESAADYEAFTDSSRNAKASKYSFLNKAGQFFDSMREAAKRGTVSVINAVQPFDAENSVAFDANFLRGYTAEQRDLDVGDLKDVAAWQAAALGREKIRPSLEEYGRGVAWEKQKITHIGSRWFASYLPVWLYAVDHHPEDADMPVRYYVAANGRSGKTSGALPISNKRITIATGILAALTFLLCAAATVYTFMNMGSMSIAVPFMALGLTVIIPLIVWLVSTTWLIQRTMRLTLTYDFETSTRGRIAHVETSDEFSGTINTRLPKVSGRNDHNPRASLRGSTVREAPVEAPGTGPSDNVQQAPADRPGTTP